ncbi:MAG: YdcF family protein [Oscillospiraceae bacterium]|nr:YdcF family protein [Oscillospiraceae bacterium]
MIDFFIFSIFILFIIVSFIMLLGYRKYHDGHYDNEVIVVLGYNSKKDRPSFILQKRLEYAKKILQNNPTSICILSGGKINKYNISECDLMYEYLVFENKIHNHIYKENLSRNTFENIKFSKEIIDKKFLNKKIIIITDIYHQFRSQYYFKKLGIYSSGIDIVNVSFITIINWIREICAIIHLFFMRKK